MLRFDSPIFTHIGTPCKPRFATTGIDVNTASGTSLGEDVTKIRDFIDANSPPRAIFRREVRQNVARLMEIAATAASVPRASPVHVSVSIIQRLYCGGKKRVRWAARRSRRGVAMVQKRTLALHASAAPSVQNTYGPGPRVTISTNTIVSTSDPQGNFLAESGGTVGFRGLVSTPLLHSLQQRQQQRQQWSTVSR